MNAINVEEYKSDLEQVKAIVCNDPKTVSIIEKIQYMIDEYAKQHGVEVEPVRHGRWIETKPYLSSVKCSICKNVWDMETPYCPSCGAKMD